MRRDPESRTIAKFATIWLEPDFPTAEDPHALIGAAGMEFPPYTGEEELAHRLATEAGKHGANTIVFMNLGNTAAVALAYHVSEAEPKIERPPAELLLADAVRTLEGYTATGSTLSRSLGAWEPIQLEAKRGSCYQLAFALEPDAELSKNARIRMQMAPRLSTDTGPEHAPTMVAEDLSLRARSFTATLGCPQMNGTLLADLQVAAAGDWGGHDFGHGTVRVQVVQRVISEAELRERQARVDEAVVRSAEEQKASEREACRKCSLELRFCPEGSDPSHCDAFTRCLSRVYVSPDVCGNQPVDQGTGTPTCAPIRRVSCSKSSLHA